MYNGSVKLVVILGAIWDHYGKVIKGKKRVLWKLESNKIQTNYYK